MSVDQFDRNIDALFDRLVALTGFARREAVDAGQSAVKMRRTSLLRAVVGS